MAGISATGRRVEDSVTPSGSKDRVSRQAGGVHGRAPTARHGSFMTSSSANGWAARDEASKGESSRKSGGGNSDGCVRVTVTTSMSYKVTTEMS